MKVNQPIVVRKEIDLNITGVTLLSVDKYMQAREYIPFVNSVWWLRSSGHRDHDVWCAWGGFGLIYDGSTKQKSGIRPALIISNLKDSGFFIGDKFELASHRWTVISDNTALCDDIVGRCAFRKDWKSEDANSYEKSDAKKWLEKWWSREVARRN